MVASWPFMPRRPFEARTPAPEIDGGASAAFDARAMMDA
jgi:hypothetical protein